MVRKKFAPVHVRISRTIRRLRDRAIGQIGIDQYRSLGMTIGSDVQLGPNCRFDPATAWMITIGDDVVFAPSVQILAHDASLRRIVGYTRVKQTIIGSRVFVGAGSIIMPGVTVGNDVVVGAGSVVTRDIPDNSVAYGNPAKVQRKTSDLVQEYHRRVHSDEILHRTVPGSPFSEEEKRQMRISTEQGGTLWVP